MQTTLDIRLKKKNQKEIKTLIREINSLIPTGITVAEACRKVGLAESTYYKNYRRVRKPRVKPCTPQIVAYPEDVKLSFGADDSLPEVLPETHNDHKSENEACETGRNSVKAGLKPGETRATFIISEEHLEAIKALAYWERKSIKDVLNETITNYLLKEKSSVAKAIALKNNETNEVLERDETAPSPSDARSMEQSPLEIENRKLRDFILNKIVGI